MCGSTCGRTSSAIASGRTTRRSSPPAARPGTGWRRRPTAWPRSPAASGPERSAIRAVGITEGHASRGWGLLEGVRTMKPRRENAEALAEAADDEIAAAVASDPDAAPILREGELDAFLAREAERDLYGVARLRRQ